MIPTGVLLLASLIPPAHAEERPADEDEEQPLPPPPPAPTSEEGEPSEIVVVTGTRTETPISEAVVTTEVVTRDDIEGSGASDASEALEMAHGVQVDRTFRGAGIRLQGLDPKYTLILVDGQRVIGRRDGVIDLSLIPAERIDHIEIVKGAASALYGSDAIAGVVNIITRKPKDPWHVLGRASYGSRNTVDASTAVDLQKHPWTAGLEVGIHATDGYDLDPSDEQTDGSRLRGASGGFDASRKFGQAVRILADGSYAIRDSRRVDVYEGTFDVRNLTEEGGLRLSTDVLAGHRTRVQGGVFASVYRDQLAEDQRGSDELDDYEQLLETLLQVDVMATAALGDHVVTAGGEGALERMESPRLQSADPSLVLDGMGQRYRAGLFAQDQWTMGERRPLQVVPSGRLDTDSWFGVHGTPRLAVRWDPHEHVAMRASAGLGYRAPSFKEMFLLYENPSANYRVEGNPDLGPETSWSVSVGLEVAASGAVTLQADAWRNTLTEMIDYAFVSEADATGPARYRYKNVASALSEGIDTSVRVRPQGPFTLDLGYTYTWTQDLDLGLPLNGRARHRGSAAATVEVPHLESTCTIRAEVSGLSYYYDDDVADDGVTLVEVGSYANLHARLEQPLARGRLRLFAGVDNLLGKGDPLYVHVDPRTFYGGLATDLPTTPE